MSYSINTEGIKKLAYFFQCQKEIHYHWNQVKGHHLQNQNQMPLPEVINIYKNVEDFETLLAEEINLPQEKKENNVTKTLNGKQTYPHTNDTRTSLLRYELAKKLVANNKKSEKYEDSFRPKPIYLKSKRTTKHNKRYKEKNRDK